MLSKKKYNEIINCEFENLIKPEKVEELLSGLGKNNVATINAGWYLDKPEYIQKLIQKEYDNSIKKIQSLDQNKKDKNLNQINKIVLSTIKKLPKIKNKEKLNEQFIILNECDKLLDSLKNNSNEEEKITIEELKAYISSGIIFIESIREEKIKKLS
jgi:hypothetical protein